MRVLWHGIISPLTILSTTAINSSSGIGSDAVGGSGIDGCHAARACGREIERRARRGESSVSPGAGGVIGHRRRTAARAGGSGRAPGGRSGWGGGGGKSDSRLGRARTRVSRRTLLPLRSLRLLLLASLEATATTMSQTFCPCVERLLPLMASEQPKV